MTSEIKLIIADKSESVTNTYQKYFYYDKSVETKKKDVRELEGYDCLILPSSSGFGIHHSSGFVRDLVSWLGADFEEKIQQHIVKSYYGEVPAGAGFVVKTPKSQSSRYKYVCYVVLFRMLALKQDELAWADSCFIPDDWAYTAFRGAILAVLQHNLNVKHKNDKIHTVVCPDFFAVRRQSVDGEVTMKTSAFEACCKQMWIAWRGFIKPLTTTLGRQEAILLQREIFHFTIKEKEKQSVIVTESPHKSAESTSRRLNDRTENDSTEELRKLLLSGELINRGICSQEELTAVISWVCDTTDKIRQIAAIKTIVTAVTSPPSMYALKPEEICKQICSPEDGCIAHLLAAIQDGKITVHTEIPLDQLELGEEIGMGTVGSVLKGIWKPRSLPVAVKKFRAAEVSFDDFMKELSKMSIVTHRNLVKCYGGSTTNGNMFIVQELMQANLTDILADRTIEMDLGIRMRIALEVAQGMNFLHQTCNLLHRDLKSPNLLINSTKDGIEVKICDFGVSRVIDKRKTMTGHVGTVSWIAPEIFEQKRYTEKSDVYSFGIVLWELLTRKIPFDDINSFSIPIAVIKGDRPSIPRDCLPPLKKLIKQCWHAKPSRRPTFQKCIESLKKIIEAIPPAQKQQQTLNLSSLHRSSTERSAVTDKKRSRYRAQNENNTQHVADLAIESAGNNRTATVTPHSPRAELQSEREVEDTDNDSDDSFHDRKEFRDSEAPPRTKTVTCQVPPKWASSIAKLELVVNKYFSRLRQDLQSGTITIGDERYLLMRSTSLTMDFFETMKQSFEFATDEESVEFSQNFLYDLGYYLGKGDALHFFKKMKLEDLIARNNVGLVHVAYTGLAYVNVLPETTFSVFADDELMIFENSYSAEAEYWRQNNRGKRTDWPTCVMSAGYMSGWSEGATGTARVTVEVLCKAQGDERCLFVRTSPNKIIHKVKEWTEIKKLKWTVPKFLQNRDMLNPSKKSDSSWLFKVFSKLVEKEPPKESTSTTVQDKSHFEPKRFTSPTLTVEEIEKVASHELDSFFIDPTSATVEIAKERCILLRGNALSFGFFSMLRDLFKVDSQEVVHEVGAKLLFDLGRMIGKANEIWMTKLLELKDNAFERLYALPINMAYFGWCDFVVVQGLNSKEILKQKEDFKIICEINNTFEVVSWLTHCKSDADTNSKIKHPVCYMHAGYLSGWFEACFGMKVVAVETSCQAMGAKMCQFVVAHVNNIRKFVPVEVPELGIGLNIAVASSLAKLLHEKRRTSQTSRSVTHHELKSNRQSASNTANISANNRN
jgi:serine/threonine protein kinase